MRRTSLVAAAMGLAGAVLLPSCAGGIGTAPDDGTRGQSLDPANPSEDGAPAAARSSAESTDTVEGVVVEVSLGERTMTLEQPVRGFSVVALDDRATLLHADGTAADLAEHIATGSAIRATGRRGPSPETLLASQVVILGEE